MNTINTHKTQKAVMYVRVSSEEQIDNYSLATQEEFCYKDAQKRDYEIIAVFREEGKSAKNITGRPTLIKMLEYCFRNRKKIDYLIVYKIDRLARQAVDYLIIRSKLRNYGIEVLSCTEPTGDTPAERAMEGVFAIFAQFDNEIKSERSRNGMHARFQSGLPNAVPLGYLFEDGFVIKDPSVYDTVKMAWDLMATGTKSIYEVAETLDLQSLRIHGKRPMGKHLYRVFRNKFYCGILTSKTYNEEIVGQHSPMITHEQYNKVQKIINLRISKNPKIIRYGANHPDFPYKRHIRCGKCNHFMTAAWSLGRCKKYPYYKCSIQCVNISINSNKMHKMVDEVVKQTPIPDKNKQILLNLFQVRSEKNMKSAYFKIRTIDDKKSQLNEDKNTVIKKNIEGIYSDEIFKEQLQLIRQQLTTLETEKNIALIYRSNMNKLINSFQELLINFHNTFNIATTLQKQVLLHYLFPSGLLWDYNGLLKVNPVRAEKSVTEQRCKEAFNVLLELIENQKLI